MSLKKHLFVSLFCAPLVFASACSCGDDDDTGDQPDAEPDDTPDASSDETFLGTMAVVWVFVPGLEDTVGQGPLLETLFEARSEFTPPVYEDSPGSPFACKVYEYTPEQAAEAVTGHDQGTSQYTVEGAPEYPPCTFNPGGGNEGQSYRCIGVTGTGVAIAEVDTGIFSVTDPDGDLSDAEIGRSLVVAGAGEATNNGAFPILDSPAANVVIIRNPAGVAEPDSPATYETMQTGPAGLNTILPEDAEVTMEFTAGGEGAVESFTETLTMPSEWTPDDATADLINNIPLDGSEFDLGCGGPGGDCGQAGATALLLRTSDGEVTAATPFFLLPPVETKQVFMFCLFLSGTVTVSAEASAYIMNSGATKIRAGVARANNAAINQDRATITALAARATAGFTFPE